MKNYSKIFAVLLALAMIVPGFAQLAVADNGTPEVIRLSGKNRVETSIKVSQKAYDDEGADTVVLAGYNGEADALTGTLLAEAKDAPVLLTYKDYLDSALSAEIDRLGANKVYILGGTQVVSEEVEDVLEAKDLEVIRLTGSTRIETAVNIAKEVFGDEKPEEAYFIEFNALSDALAIGPVAADKDSPILITLTDKVPSETADAIEEMEIGKGTIIGGNTALSDEGKTALEELIGNPLPRVYGKNRVATSLEIAKKYFEKPEAVIVANGWTLADALVGGYFGQMMNAPILLSETDKIHDDILDYIKSMEVDVYIFGGTVAIGKIVFEKIEDLFEKDDPVDPEPELQDVEFELVPEDAKVVVKSDGEVVAPVSNGVYRLKAGNYTYEVSKEGYETATGNFTITDENMTIEVTLELEEEADEEAIKKVEDMIDALPEAKDVTIDDADEIGKARNAFNNLTIEEQDKVKNKEKFFEVLKALESLENEYLIVLATELVEIAEDTREPEDIAFAQEAIDQLAESQAKAALQARLDAIVPIGDEDTGSNSEDDFVSATASSNFF